MIIQYNVFISIVISTSLDIYANFLDNINHPNEAKAIRQISIAIILSVAIFTIVDLITLIKAL